jgi:hypothetical protein
LGRYITVNFHGLFGKLNKHRSTSIHFCASLDEVLVGTYGPPHAGAVEPYRPASWTRLQYHRQPLACSFRIKWTLLLCCRGSIPYLGYLLARQSIQSGAISSVIPHSAIFRTHSLLFLDNPKFLVSLGAAQPHTLGPRGRDWQRCLGINTFQNS